MEDIDPDIVRCANCGHHYVQGIRPEECNECDGTIFQPVPDDELRDDDPKPRDHWDELRDRAIDVDMGDCGLCKTFEAERMETVQADESGREMTVEFCQDCWEKTMEYQQDESVSFDDELRLREMNTNE